MRSMDPGIRISDVISKRRVVVPTDLAIAKGVLG